MKKFSIESKIKSLKKDVEKLSYESSLNKLDIILNELQNESINLEEIQDKYIHAKIYLQHCQDLLDIADQKIIQLDSMMQEIKDPKTHFSD